MKFFLINNKNFYVSFTLFAFFIGYILIVLVFKKEYYVGDEPRYLMFANNILHGYYSPPPPEINLWNGPGYPLLIALTKVLHLPELSVRLLNAVWLYLTLILTYKTFTLLQIKKKLPAVIFLGFYLPVYVMLPKILTESFAWFLIGLLTYLMVKYLSKNIQKKQLFLIALVLLVLMLTKVVFAYAVLSLALITAIWFLFSRNPKVKAVFQVFVLALFMSTPYMIYTYRLTGKVFYWSNAASLSLYTMSTPYADENGSFMTPRYLATNPKHRQEVDSIMVRLPALQMDEALQKAAIRNIKNHPFKYFKNWLSNLGRLFIGYPFLTGAISFKFKLFSWVNLIWLFILLIALLRWFLLKISLPFSITILLLFFAIYLSGSSLVSAFPRMFYITLPFWTVWAFYILARTPIIFGLYKK